MHEHQIKTVGNFIDPICGMTVQPEPMSGAADVEYTCPMHPEIVQIGPGTCPKC